MRLRRNSSSTISGKTLENFTIFTGEPSHTALEMELRQRIDELRKTTKDNYVYEDPIISLSPKAAS